MRFQIDTSLHWAVHYVEHGFCVIKGALDSDFCRRGIAAYQEALGTTLPPAQWSTETLANKHDRGRMPLGPEIDPFLATVFDQPGMRGAIDTMLGGQDVWNGDRHCSAFLCVFDPANLQTYPSWGHVDFLKVRIPILGNGFAFQASLIDTEPYSGNITIYPGYHKIVQRKLLDDPGFWFAESGFQHEAWRKLVPDVEPFEFVAEAGDLLFFHHLVGHQGNVNAAAGRTPRMAIHGLVSAREWLREIDPARPNLSPFERSLAQNGPISLPWTEESAQHAAYEERKYRFQMEKWAAARAGKPIPVHGGN